MDNDISLYPLKFQPILKKKVWGGNKLVEFFGKEGGGKIGESWEISAVPGNVSIVSKGKLQGENLSNLITIYKSELVGKKVYDSFRDTFPLLFKFIDAREDLSVQLHPDDSLAKERHNSFGKTEMWYIMQAERDARLILGFNREMNQLDYERFLSEDRITDILHSEKIKKGDAFFIAPGTVHAIGAGIVLAEIQQTSDITYRIFDWNRPGDDGLMRELHTQEALKAINFGLPKTKLTSRRQKNMGIPLCSTSYFETHKLDLDDDFNRDLSEIDSFVVYMCVEGKAEIVASNYSEKMQQGETILIPASISEIKIITDQAVFLEVFIP